MSNENLDSESNELKSQEVGMTLGKAWIYYAIGLICISLLFSMSWIETAILAYLAIGFFMTKFVMGGLIEWHPMHNTISNVFGAKLGMFFFWPLRMVFLLFQLSINRVL